MIYNWYSFIESNVQQTLLNRQYNIYVFRIAHTPYLQLMILNDDTPSIIIDISSIIIVLVSLYWLIQKIIFSW